MRLVAAEELSLDREPRLGCGLRGLLNDLMELRGEGAEDPGHHNVVQSIPIDERINNNGEDMVVEGVMTKREKHVVTPPLVVRRRGF
jgi:hypothetical protein